MARGRYAAIGYVVSKLVLPLAKRKMKKKARSAVSGSAGSAARAARNNPARTSVALGSLVGAAAFLLRRKRNNTGD